MRFVLAVLVVASFTRPLAAREAPLAFGVQFGGAGSGIDDAVYQAVLEVISAEISNGHLGKMLNVRWGRKNESSLCLQFADHNQSWQGLLKVQRIIKRSKKADGKAALTTTKVLLRCDDVSFGRFTGDDRSLEVYGEKAIRD